MIEKRMRRKKMKKKEETKNYFYQASVLPPSLPSFLSLSFSLFYSSLVK